MKAYSKTDPMGVYEVEGMLYIQEAQLDKYRQEPGAPNASANIVEDGVNTQATRPTNSGGLGYYLCGRGKPYRGRGRSRSNFTTRNRSTCQLCNKNRHANMDCWHEFDEHFEPIPPK